MKYRLTIDVELNPQIYPPNMEPEVVAMMIFGADLIGRATAIAAEDGMTGCVVKDRNGGEIGKMRVEDVPMQPIEAVLGLYDVRLFAAAVCAGVARWEPFSGATSKGEIAVEGLRYSTSLDPDGVPLLNSVSRAALQRALGR